MYVFTVPVLNVGSYGLKLMYQPEKKSKGFVSFCSSTTCTWTSWSLTSQIPWIQISFINMVRSWTAFTCCSQKCLDWCSDWFSWRAKLTPTYLRQQLMLRGTRVRIGNAWPCLNHLIKRAVAVAVWSVSLTEPQTTTALSQRWAWDGFQPEGSAALPSLCSWSPFFNFIVMRFCLQVGDTSKNLQESLWVNCLRLVCEIQHCVYFQECCFGFFYLTFFWWYLEETWHSVINTYVMLS